MIPDITISIVSYNTREVLRNCLTSLTARQDAGEVTLQIIVADNGSKDDSVSMVHAEFPDVHVIQTGGNIGYGRANNTALAEAQGRYVLVLNSDTEVEPGALAAMRDFLDAHRDIGMVVAQLILPDGSIQASCARDPDLWSVFWEQTYFQKLLPQSRITGRYFMTHWDYSDCRSIEQAAGACFFVRREAYEQIGGFDPAYFMYFEDTDFCIRLRRAGWPIYYLPQAKIRHHLGASSGGEWRIRAQMIAAYNQSRYYYFSRYGGPAQGKTLKVFVLLGAFLRLAAWSLLAIKRPAAREQARIFLNVWQCAWRMGTEAGSEA